MSKRSPDIVGVFVHESAYVDEPCEIGGGTKIWHFSHVLKDSKIGHNCVLGQNVVVGPGAIIGNNCKIQNNVSVYDNVTLDDDVFCGPSMVFTNVYNPRSLVERKDQYRNTLIKHGATLGANCTIVCGIEVGQFAFIGAGSVVNKDVKAYATAIVKEKEYLDANIGVHTAENEPSKVLAEKSEKSSVSNFSTKGAASAPVGARLCVRHDS